MINFDYSLVKNEGDEEVTYKPSVIPNELDNLVYIKAANSSGKSTLLNIIALGFYGLKSKNLDPSLQKKMNGLINSQHQKLDARICIGDRTGKTKLVSTIANGKCEVRKFENDKEYVILPDRFEREYNLIYDIPHNPTERLRELTREIETIQQNLGRQVLDFSKFLNSTVNEIQDSQDPNKINEHKKNFKEKSGHITPLNQEIVRNEERMGNLQQLLNIKFLKYYKDKKDMAQSQLSRINRNSEQQKNENQAKRRHDENLIRTITLAFSKINNAHDNLLKDLKENLPDTQKQNLEKWRKIETFEDLKIDQYINDEDFGEAILKLSSVFSKILNEEIERTEYHTAIREGEIYEEIIRFFVRLSDTYNNENIILPGIDKTIEDFVALLYKKNEENTKRKRKYDTINTVTKKLKDINDEIDLIKNKYFKEYQRQKEQQENEPINIETTKDLIDIQIQSSTENIKKFQQKYDYYKNKCQDHGIMLLNLESNYKEIMSSKKIPSQFKEYTEDQLIQEIETINSNLMEMRKDKKKLDSDIKYIQKEIENLSQKKVHKLHNKKEEIESLYIACQKISQKISKTYGDYLKNISNGKNQVIDLKDADQSLYYNALSKYLAKKLNFIYYNGRSYKVMELNLITEQITMTDDLNTKTIHFLDFGTGESQAALLKGLLETAKTDNRKILALFDEVGMIDEKRLAIVTDSLKQLYAEDKLLIGIVVQKGQDAAPEIKSLL